MVKNAILCLANVSIQRRIFEQICIMFRQQKIGKMMMRQKIAENIKILQKQKHQNETQIEFVEDVFFNVPFPASSLLTGLLKQTVQNFTTN